MGKNRLALTYDPEVCRDGTGAQLLRVMSILTTARMCNLTPVFTPLTSVTITPLDSFQTIQELDCYISNLNRLIESEFEISSDSSNSIKVKVNTLNFKYLLKFGIKALIERKSYLIYCGNAFGISERNSIVNESMDLSRLLEALNQSKLHFSQSGKLKDKKQVVVHYRRGSNGKDILKFESQPRSLSNEYYIQAIQKIIHKSIYRYENSDEIKITIVTDCPERDFVYRPPHFQLDRWQDEPRIIDGEIQVQGEDFGWLLKTFPNKSIEIIRGGNPLDCLLIMANSENLVISRSAFSFAAAIIGKVQNVISPEKFVHNIPRTWTVMV